MSVKDFQPISGQQQPRPAKSRPRQETSVRVEGSSASNHQQRCPQSQLHLVVVAHIPPQLPLLPPTTPLPLSHASASDSSPDDIARTRMEELGRPASRMKHHISPSERVAADD